MEQFIYGPVGTSPEGIRAVFHCLRAPKMDLTSQDVLNISRDHQAHPDSIRLLATELYRRYKAGHPYTTVCCAALTNPHQSMAAENNAVHNLTIAFGQDAATRARSPDCLSCSKEFVVADVNTYAFVNRTMSKKGRAVISIQSVAKQYTKASFDRIADQITAGMKVEVNAPREKWFSDLADAFSGFMSEDSLVKIFLHVVAAFEVLVRVDGIVGTVDLVFMVEGRTLAAIPKKLPRKVVVLKEFMMRWASTLLDMNARSSEVAGFPEACGGCRIPRKILVSCPRCGEPRACCSRCLDVDWNKTHKRSCAFACSEDVVD
jgi:hypothetical protein